MGTLYRIAGGRRLSGEITASGAKNAALPILFASLLFEKGCEIENLPDIRDVSVALSILRKLGCDPVELTDGAWHISGGNVPHGLCLSEAAALRAGVYLLGACLPVFGKVTIPYPGGCNFGRRPIDYHLAALRKMGASIEEKDGMITARAEKLYGAEIFLPRPSVGATVNILLAAALAEGTTELYGAAAEPHINDLIRFLQSGGAKITLFGDGHIRMQGVSALSPIRHRLIGDSIEAATYLLFGAVTGGQVTVKGVVPDEFDAFSDVMKRIGCQLTANRDAITLYPTAHMQATDVTTAPYPAFPTDLQPPITACLALAEGESHITEAVWQDRFGYIGELQKLGANVTLCQSTLTVRQSIPHGGHVTATDLRGGAALLLLAGCASGESLLFSGETVERGYERLDEKLRMLGADIERIPIKSDL